MSSSLENLTSPQTLAGARVALVGKLAGMSRREAQKLVRQHGATAVEDARDASGNCRWPRP